MLTVEHADKLFSGLYYIDYFKFRDYMFIGSHSDYLWSKWELFKQSPTAFWGSLDGINKVQFVLLLNSM